MDPAKREGRVMLRDWRVVRESRVERGLPGTMVGEEAGKDVAQSIMGRRLDLDCRRPESLMGFEDGSGLILSVF